MESKNKIWMTPNILSFLRIGLTPVICSLLLMQSVRARNYAFVIFLIACGTDYMDGYIARHQKQSSSFGTVLDPFADKCLICSISFTLMYGQFCDITKFLCLSLMMLRDIAINTLRSFVGHYRVPVHLYAKIKTAFQMVGIAIMILPSAHTSSTASLMLLMSCFISIYTGAAYFFRAFKYF
ncbi:CDP-alcohol phosphatidyltransferase family protein [Holospora curviuscula]|uniref:CDP-diacylglycerol--glycerol-3-phosphate 3-phosphatidyltransferase n=1 Tax=Holospora curviuscula TaxID=1082868 RepID=A0A2S5RA54_9PROT|nr:CDP-alcohol phosphatidyltransferase family protein [Holospora curviuscula]PPE04209.1 CDP-diacylglycerol--glycerol-3-phosphate 3-phosphatidyltransferase [Holospora curviuscula]